MFVITGLLAWLFGHLFRKSLKNRERNRWYDWFAGLFVGLTLMQAAIGLGVLFDENLLRRWYTLPLMLLGTGALWGLWFLAIKHVIKAGTYEMLKFWTIVSFGGLLIYSFFAYLDDYAPSFFWGVLGFFSIPGLAFWCYGSFVECFRLHRCPNCYEMTLIPGKENITGRTTEVSTEYDDSHYDNSDWEGDEHVRRAGVRRKHYIKTVVREHFYRECFCLRCTWSGELEGSRVVDSKKELDSVTTKERVERTKFNL